VGVGSLLFLVPSYYFLRQNYQIFLKLAFHQSPGLVQYLEQEVIWLTGFMMASFVAIISLITVVATNMTARLISPLLALQKHMKQVMNGHWNIPSINVEKMGEDFRELSLTYDYLYRSLAAQAESDLKLLSQFNIDPNNRDACLAWEKLIQQKKDQLGIIDTLTLTEKGYKLATQNADAKLIDLTQQLQRNAQAPSAIGNPSRPGAVRHEGPSLRRVV